MGSGNPSDICDTCSNTKTGRRRGEGGCLAHRAVYPFNTPVPSPLFIQDQLKLLRIFCPDCRCLKIPPDERKAVLGRGTYRQRTTRASKKVVGECWNCGKFRYQGLAKDPTDYVSLTRLERGVPVRIAPAEIAAVLGSISAEDRAWIGLTPDLDPAALMFYSLPVLSPVMRPDTRNTAGRTNADDLTQMNVLIIKYNSVIPPDTGRDGVFRMSADLEQRVRSLATVVYRKLVGGESNQDKPMSRSSKPGADGGKFRVTGANDGANTIKVRLMGKFGLVRRKVESRRVGELGRSVIVNGPWTDLFTVQMPLKFARTCQREMAVCESNLEFALMVVANGRQQYPGCSMIIKKSTGVRYWADNISTDFQLEIGDIVYRDLVNGDVVMFNRMPSLQRYSAIAMFVKIVDENVYRHNDKVCKCFNSDFDGDEMQTWNAVTGCATAELLTVSSMDNMAVNTADGSPMHGAVYDDIEGGAALCDALPMSRWDAMLVCNRAPIVPDFNAQKDLGSKGTFSGRDIISMYLTKLAPINYTQETMLANPIYKDFFDMPEDGLRTTIVHGVMKSGRLDKKIYGEGAKNGLHHQILNAFGADVALNVVFIIQQLVFGYMRWKSHSIGYGDLMLSRKTRETLKEIVTNVATESAVIEDQLTRGLMVPPIHSTVSEFYEDHLFKIMGIRDQLLAGLLSGLDPFKNELVRLVLSGTKAKTEHLTSILGALTAITEAGKLPRRTFGYKRVSMFHQRCDNSASGRGFVGNSFASGMTLTEFLFATMNGRVALILKSLMTATAGELYRDTVKNGETFIVDHYLSVVRGEFLVRPLYGNDGMDPALTKPVDVKSLYKSKKEIVEIIIGKVKPSPEEMLALERAMNYRATFLEDVLANEAADVSSPAPSSVPLPCDVRRLVGDALFDSKASKPSSADYQRMLVAVREFDELLPGLYTNPNVKKLPAAFANGVQRLRTHIAFELTPVKLRRLTPALLEGILQEIRLRFYGALVSPGLCAGILAAEVFGEPTTQAMLNSTHLAASASKNATNAAESVRSLLQGSSDRSQPMYVVPKNIRVELLAGMIEKTSLQRLVLRWEIFHEPFGKPRHPLYRHESKFIQEFLESTPRDVPPAKEMSLCVRVVLDRVILASRDVRVETVVSAIEDNFKDTFVVYSPESAPDDSPLGSPAGPGTLLLRVYLCARRYPKGPPRLRDIVATVREMLEMSVSGVDNVDSAEISTMPRHILAEDGSYQKYQQDVVVTSGSNFYDVCLRDNVDAAHTLTDSVEELAQTFGIESVRARIEHRMIKVAGGQQYAQAHLGMFSDAMTSTGVSVSLISGIISRDRRTICLGITHKHAKQILTVASVNGTVDPMIDPSAHLMVGHPPPVGTRYCPLVVNEEEVQSRASDPGDVLDALAAL